MGCGSVLGNHAQPENSCAVAKKCLQHGIRRFTATGDKAFGDSGFCSRYRQGVYALVVSDLTGIGDTDAHARDNCFMRRFTAPHCDNTVGFARQPHRAPVRPGPVWWSPAPA